MANTLTNVSGNFVETTKYNMGNYTEYLRKLRAHTVHIQKDLINVAKALRNCVMIEGKWYDDSAAEFATWWNDVAGQSDGIDKLNGISTIMENLIKTTALDVSKALASNPQAKKSMDYYPIIKEYANAKNAYIGGVEDVNKKLLGLISEVKCRKGVELKADKASIKTMINAVGDGLNDINTRIGSVKTLVQSNIIDGKAIKVAGMDSSTLNKYVNSVKKRLDEVQDELYVKLLEDAESHKVANNILKAALKKNYDAK